MQFCFLTTFFPPYHFGGDAVMVANLANALAAEGHHVEVVHCFDSFEMVRGPVQPSAFPLHPGVVVHTLRSRFGMLSPALTFATGQPWLKHAALRKILQRDFDVVHWHNLSLVGGPGALRHGKGVRLYTAHEYWLICPTHILFRNREEACTARSCLRCSLKHGRPPQLWRYTGMLPRSLRYVDRFLVPSQFVRQKLLESELKIDATVLPHFIDSQPRHPRQQAGTQPYYLYVGRLEKAKGIQTILPAFRNGRRRLLVAGSGNYERELRQQASGLRTVEFLGKVPHAELAGLYAGALATLMPSICHETFGLTILESLAQATPVITSRYGALPELVRDTGGGETYGDLTGLESTMARFEAAPGYGRALGERGHATLGRYSVRSYLDRYLALVNDIRAQKEFSRSRPPFPPLSAPGAA